MIVLLERVLKVLLERRIAHLINLFGEELLFKLFAAFSEHFEELVSLPSQPNIVFVNEERLHVQKVKSFEEALALILFVPVYDAVSLFEVLNPVGGLLEIGVE